MSLSILFVLLSSIFSSFSLRVSLSIFSSWDFIFSSFSSSSSFSGPGISSSSFISEFRGKLYFSANFIMLTLSGSVEFDKVYILLIGPFFSKNCCKTLINTYKLGIIFLFFFFFIFFIFFYIIITYIIIIIYFIFF